MNQRASHEKGKKAQLSRRFHYLAPEFHGGGTYVKTDEHNSQNTWVRQTPSELLLARSVCSLQQQHPIMSVRRSSELGGSSRSRLHLALSCLGSGHRIETRDTVFRIRAEAIYHHGPRLQSVDNSQAITNSTRLWPKDWVLRAICPHSALRHWLELSPGKRFEKFFSQPDLL